MYPSELESKRVERKARAQHRLAIAKKGLSRLDKGVVTYTKHHPIVAVFVALTAGLLAMPLLFASPRRRATWRFGRAWRP